MATVNATAVIATRTIAGLSNRIRAALIEVLWWARRLILDEVVISGWMKVCLPGRLVHESRS